MGAAHPDHRNREIECRVFCRFEAGADRGTVQPCISIAGRAVASFLLSGARMDHNGLRSRIRQLIASGDLPTISPLASGTLSAPAGIRRISIERSLPDPCVICGEANPTVAYTYAKGRIVFLHAACDALWRQEREAEA